MHLSNATLQHHRYDVELERAPELLGDIVAADRIFKCQVEFVRGVNSSRAVFAPRTRARITASAPNVHADVLLKFLHNCCLRVPVDRRSP